MAQPPVGVKSKKRGGSGRSRAVRITFCPGVSIDRWATVPEPVARVELYPQVAPEAPADREHTIPDGDENPLGAWYVKTDIHGAAEGPLAGRTVAIKDNPAVAGVPMMNGSHTLAGFVPSRDATVVSRLLEAGGDRQGEGGLGGPWFSWGGPPPW